MIVALRNGVIISKKDISNEDLKRSLPFVPTLLEFASYIHFGGTSLVGTFFEIKDFTEWAECKGKFSTLPLDGFASIKQSVTRLSQGLLCLTIYVIGEYFLEFDIALLGSPNYVTFGDDAWVPFWKRIGIFQTAMSTLRLLYYSVWSFADVSLILSGLSYDGSYKETPKNYL